MGDSRGGLALGAGAYLCWGFFPLYWRLLDSVGSLETLAQRCAWSLVFVMALVVVMGRWRHLRAIGRDRRLLVVLALASVSIAANWGVFIYAVTHDHVIETSLGYFINPLVTVAVGVVVLKETLRRAQWGAVAIGAVAVVVLTVEHGRLPWIALSLAGTFATYGYLKKTADLGAFEALGMETLILAPFAVGYLVALQVSGDLTFGHTGPHDALLLAGTGLVTAIPLLLFGAAATRLPMTTIGLLQYLAPVLHFVLGLTVFGEHMSPARWVGFALVWVALALFTVDAVRHARRDAPEPAAV